MKVEKDKLNIELDFTQDEFRKLAEHLCSFLIRDNYTIDNIEHALSIGAFLYLCKKAGFIFNERETAMVEHYIHNFLK